MFFPQFTQPQQFIDMYRKVVSEHLGRIEALNEQLEGMEAKGFERATEVVEESAKMMKASIETTRELTLAWQRQSLEMAKQAATAFTPTV